METITRKTSVPTLIRALTSDFKTFIKQELDLAKTELSEKISLLGKNAVSLAIGGFIAYAGLIVFLIGLGWLLAFAFQAAGLSREMSSFLGMAVIGLLIMLVGGAFIGKAVSAFSKNSLKPEKTIHTLQDLKGTPGFEQHDLEEAHEEEEKPSSAQLEAEVTATEERMGATLNELTYRLSPRHINDQVKNRISEKPYKAGLIAMGAGVVSGILVSHKLKKS